MSTFANFNGNALGSASGSNTGDVTLAAVDSVPNANAAVLTGQQFQLEPCDGTHPGVVTSGSQVIGGQKDFAGGIKADAIASHSAATIVSTSSVADGATAVAHARDTGVALATVGAKLDSVRLNGTEVSFTDLAGLLSTATPHPALKRLGQYLVVGDGASSVTAVGMSAATTSGSAFGGADTARNDIHWQSGATSGNVAGIKGPFTQTKPAFLPRMTALVGPNNGNQAANIRMMVGLAASDVSGVSTLAGLNSIKCALFRYDTGLGDTHWMAVTSDGTTASATDTGVAPVFTGDGHTYATLQVDLFTSGTAVFRLNNATTPQVIKSSNVPTGSTLLGVQCSITTLTSNNSDMNIASVFLEQNP